MNKEQVYTSPKTYTDMSGNTRTFVDIDCDKKVTSAPMLDTTKEGHVSAVEKSVNEYRERLVQRITSISASYCPEKFWDFTIRGEAVTTITWNEDKLKDSAMETQKLREICVLLEKKINP